MSDSLTGTPKVTQHSYFTVMSNPSRYYWGVFVLVILAVGFNLRVGDQATKSFWLDEVWRAQQIVNTSSYRELKQGNYFGREAPVLYSEYLFGKLGVSLLGKKELAFRIWPLCFSLLSLGLFAWCAIRHLSPAFALCAMTLFACSNGFVEHSFEFKPYSLEVLLALLLFSFISATQLSPRIALSGAAATFIAMFVSSNIWVFYCFVPLIVFQAANSHVIRKLPLWLWIISGLVSIVFAWYYFDYVLLLKSNNIFQFWAPYTLDTVDKWIRFFEIEIPTGLRWYALSLFDLKEISNRWFHFAAFVALVITPAIAVKRDINISLFVAIPFILQCLLGVFGLYPPFTRVSTFFFPFIILSLCYVFDRGLQKAVKSPLHEGILTGIVGIGLVCFVLQIDQTAFRGANRHRQEIKPLIADLRSKLSTNDLVVASYSGQLAIQYYSLGRAQSSVEIVDSAGDRKLTSDEAARFVSKLSMDDPSRTIWILSMHRVEGYPIYKNAMTKAGYKAFYDKRLPGAYLIGFRQLTLSGQGN